MRPTPETPKRKAAAKVKPAAGKGARLRLRLAYGDDVAIGPGKADLLEGIRDTGSIAAAGRAMGIGYKRAWLLVETMNRCFAEPLVTASRGGTGHGSSVLTAAGEAVLDSYRRLVKSTDASSDLKAIRSLLASSSRR